MARKQRIPTIPNPKAHLLLPQPTKPTAKDRAKWLEARRAGIGASEIGALIGANEHMTPFDVFRNKVGEPQDLSGNPYIEWGHRLEEAVAQKTAHEIGLVSRTGGGLWQSNEHEFALVTPDRFATKNLKYEALGVIECKTAGDDEYWAEGSAPLTYQAQVQWQLGILGLEIGWLGCLVLGSSRDFYVYEVRFDPEWFGEMLDEAERFWHKHVLAWEPPMLDVSHPRTEELAKELYPRAIQKSVELDEDAQEWVKAYHEAKADLDRAQQRVDEAKNGLRLYMADAAQGYVGDTLVISYPEVRPRSVSVEKLRENYPEIAEEVTVRTLHRRLLVKKLPEAES